MQQSFQGVVHNNNINNNDNINDNIVLHNNNDNVAIQQPVIDQVNNNNNNDSVYNQLVAFLNKLLLAIITCTDSIVQLLKLNVKI